MSSVGSWMNLFPADYFVIVQMTDPARRGRAISMVPRIANHVVHSEVGLRHLGAVDHSMREVGIKALIVTFAAGIFMDVGDDVRVTRLIMAGQAGRGCPGQESVRGRGGVFEIVMVKEVVTMAPYAAAGLHGNSSGAVLCPQ